MHKRNVRAFSFGILFSVIIVALYTLITDEKPIETAYNKNDAKAYLEEAGYTVLTEEEIQERMETTTEKETEQRSPAAEEEIENDSNEALEEKTAPEEPPPPFQLEISEGMNPTQIASILLQAGLIEDEAEFTHFVENNGYSTKIQLGSFEVTKGMSIEEIAKIITKS
ncbi:endolytic transglycosylase MltG [Cytobacillus gottheilii]|uniref:endolytic transglycosylase MltG n=1 Tax=Cytobacillus gottheilii TaxID=859144 RepID=UPI0009BB8E23|nr:endolytic transglycosylase MltG [Cytobacillus gottheilii]